MIFLCTDMHRPSTNVQSRSGIGHISLVRAAFLPAGYLLTTSLPVHSEWPLVPSSPASRSSLVSSYSYQLIHLRINSLTLFLSFGFFLHFPLHIAADSCSSLPHFMQLPRLQFLQPTDSASDKPRLLLSCRLAYFFTSPSTLSQTRVPPFPAPQRVTHFPYDSVHRRRLT